MSNSRFLGGALTWEQSEPRTYELGRGDETLARLRWQSACGSLALGECALGCWTFKRMGFFHPYVTVRPAGAPNDLATLRTEHRATRLQFADGRLFLWVRGTTRGRERSFHDAAGRPVVTFAPESRRGTLWGSVATVEAGCSDETLALLALTGWYRLVLDKMDDDAATLTAVMAATTAATS